MQRDRIRGIVARLPNGASVEDARQAVLAQVDPADVDTVEDVGNAFDQLTEQGGAQASMRQVLLRYRHADDDLVAVGPGAHLLNAHTGKGQQFDWVFIVGLENGQLPIVYADTPDALAEEQRVLLVMVSRARHGLVVTRSRTADGKFGPFTVKQSPWFPELEAAATLNGNQLVEHIKTLYPGEGQTVAGS